MDDFGRNKIKIWAGAVLVLLLVCPTYSRGQGLIVKNTSKYLGDRTWEWTIFVDGPDSLLDQVEYVKYTLHPTFSNPVQARDNRPEKFSLTRIGWGTFVIPVQIVFKNGSSQLLYHQLVFEEVQRPIGNLRPANTSQHLGEGRWRWTIYLDGNSQDLDRVKCVEYTLHPTFSNPIQLICNRSSQFAFTAIGWGTFVVRIKAFLIDGSIKEMRYQLVFQ